jgi:hypothetical protein
MMNIERVETPGTILCKSCGLCCTGHLFIWTKLRSAELDAIAARGVTVIREPKQRGYNQPCPLWEGECTIYHSPDYPRFCRTYKCKLLKHVMDEITPLSDALTRVGETKRMINELSVLLPPSANGNFRERLAAYSGNGGDDYILGLARILTGLYDEYYGVTDVLSKPPD